MTAPIVPRTATVSTAPLLTLAFELADHDLGIVTAGRPTASSMT